MDEDVLAKNQRHSAAKQIKVNLQEQSRRHDDESDLKHDISDDLDCYATQKDLQDCTGAPIPDEPQPNETEGSTEEKVEPESAPVPNEHTEESPPSISLIIPTAAYGKGPLESCLISVTEHCNTNDLKLIIVDNASLDDTHDYLDELQERTFLDCQVITNSQNAGFAISVNQALDQVDTPYACILHNDVVFK